ncbi:MAG TPA: nucleotide exchange factor GrpE [Gaiellaceae bacterium]|nr:nucleotide exchange factor GrpE [Gaiellaceae bacterium]
MTDEQQDESREPGTAQDESREPGTAQDESREPGTAAPSQAPASAEDERLLRLAADFDNYKKRAAREREEYVALANARLLAELLPVVDDLERALAAAEQHEEAQLEEGVRLVHRSLAALLERQGVKPIETNGKFDPHVHEAIAAQQSEDVESGSVLDVVQKGYKLGDRVVRPARVIVSE